MAKSVSHKKKRISHFQSTFDFTETENEKALSGCFDYVSNIMKGMDSNFNSVHSVSSKDYLPESKVTNPNEQSNSASTNEDKSQNPKKYSFKKNFTSRKFPLMEKSQKILKQLKHNRSIPKPRAHLSSLSESPIKNTIFNRTGIKKQKRKKEVNSLQRNVVSHNTRFSNNAILNSSISSSDSIMSKSENSSKEMEQKIRKDNESKSIHSTKNSFVEENADNVLKGSESETSDGEYERFVQMNKKCLQKKQRKSINRKKFSKKVNKNRLQNISKQCDSENSDGGSVLSDIKYKRTCHNKQKATCKGIMKTNSTSLTNERSDCDMHSDVYTEDFSSESDKDNKNRLQNVSKQCVSDSSDGESVSSHINYKRVSCFEKQKVDQDKMVERKISTDLDESSFSVMNEDVYMQDSSSESDNEVSLSKLRKTLPFQQKSSVCISALPRPSSLSDENCVSDTSLLPQLDPLSDKEYISSLKSNNEASISNFSETPLVQQNGIVCISTLQKSGSLSDRNCTSDTSLLKSDSLCDKEYVPDASSLIDDILSNDSPTMHSTHINSTESARTDNSNLHGIIIDLCDSDEECQTAPSHEIPTLSTHKEKNSVITNVTPNEVCSDGEESALSTPKEENYTITNVTPNAACLDGEESDLEIMEIIPRKCVQKIDNEHDCSVNIYSGTEKCQRLERTVKSNNGDKRQDIVLKTEAEGLQKDTRKALNTESHDINDSKYEAVYTTNICNEMQVSNENILHSKCNTPGDVSLDVSILNKAMKDDDSDDDIIILDPVQPPSLKSEKHPRSILNPSLHWDKKMKTEKPDILIDYVKEVNDVKMSLYDVSHQQQSNSVFTINIEKKCPSVKKEKCIENLAEVKKEDIISSKFENLIENIPLTEKKFSYEEAISNTKTLQTCKTKKEFNEFEKMSFPHLLELFKKEFEAYQTIIHTEANVEASLKLLETHQAEKLKLIRSAVQRFLESNNSSNETYNTENKEYINNILHLREKLNSVKTSVMNKPLFENNVSYTQINQDVKPDISGVDKLHIISKFHQSNVKPKLENESIVEESSSKTENYVNLSACSPEFQSDDKQTLKLLNEKCNACGKEAMAACQRCAKVFFCSHECGKKFWNGGHKNVCGK